MSDKSFSVHIRRPWRPGQPETEGLESHTDKRLHLLRAFVRQSLVEHPLSVLNEQEDYLDKTGSIVHHLGYGIVSSNLDVNSIIKLAHKEGD